MLRFFMWRWLRERFHRRDNIPIFRGRERFNNSGRPTYNGLPFAEQEPWGDDLIDYMIFRKITRKNRH